MRAQLSECFILFKELGEEDHEGYFNYFKMLPNQFDYLHNLVKPLIHKSNTANYKISIFSSLHLAAILKTNYHVIVSCFMIGLLLRPLAAIKK
jgi:hypothetical protein